jgi:hypothetical protein
MRYVREWPVRQRARTLRCADFAFQVGRIPLAQQQVMVRHEMVRAGHKMRGDIAADLRQLERIVVDIAMARVGHVIVAGDCNVDGRENCYGVIADIPGKMAVAAIASFVVTGIDHIGPEPEPR